MATSTWLLPFLLLSVHLHAPIFAYQLKLGFLFPVRTEGVRSLVIPKMGYSTSAGAVAVALERLEREQMLVREDVTVVWRDSKCEEGEAAGAAIEMITKDKVNAIIGPPCSVPAAIVGVICKYYNVASVSWAATGMELADVSRYPTLIRVIGSAIRLGRALKEIMLYFNWIRVAILVTDDKATRKCYTIAQGVVKYFPLNNIHIVLYHEIDREVPTDLEIDNFLLHFPELTRIALVCIDLDKDIRRVMLRAQQLGVSGVEYVYMMPDYVRFENHTDVWTDREEGLDSTTMRDVEARGAVQNSLFFETLLADQKELFEFKKLIVQKISGWPFFYRTTAKDEQWGSLYSPFLHDAVYAYGRAVNRTVAAGKSKDNGLEVIDAARGMNFQGYSGHVVMDDLPGREPTFVLKGFTKDLRLTELLIAEMYKPDGKTVTTLVPDYAMWETRDGYKPKWFPRCGWDGKLCLKKMDPLIPILITGGVLFGILLLSALIVGIILYRRALATQEMEQMLWKIDTRNLQKLVDMQQQGSLATIVSEVSDLAEVVLKGNDRVAYYKNLLVWLKPHTSSMILSGKADHVHLKAMRELTSDNLNMFFGLCLDGPNTVSVWAYNAKGSLQDVLLSPTLALDYYFKYSMIRDLVAGMGALHETVVVSHGNLKSSNCVVNSRWVLTITDYGLPALRNTTESNPGALLWKAPEFLRMDRPPPCGSQSGDMYRDTIHRRPTIISSQPCFAIILQEIITRDLPYGNLNKSPEEILNLVRAGLEPPFRPDCTSQNDADMDPGLVTLMKDCWLEDPKLRPDFKHVKAAMKQMSRGREVSLLDHAMKMMEKYSNTLENTITDRTKLLTDESAKSSNLLYQLLPRHVADRLKKGQTIPPETYESITVMYTNIAGFDKILAMSSPVETITLINDLYVLLDGIMDEYDVFRVQTVNDAYVIVGGLETKADQKPSASASVQNLKNHTCVVADLALHFQLSISTYYIPHLPREKCDIRIGVNTGPAVAGVLGTVVPRYYLFGDTVTTAGILLEKAKGGCVHVSESTNTYLTEVSGGYITKPRGEVMIKGVGTVFTFWLMGKKSRAIDDKTSTVSSSSGGSKSKH